MCTSSHVATRQMKEIQSVEDKWTVEVMKFGEKKERIGLKPSNPETWWVVQSSNANSATINNVMKNWDGGRKCKLKVSRKDCQMHVSLYIVTRFVNWSLAKMQADANLKKQYGKSNCLFSFRRCHMSTHTDSIDAHDHQQTHKKGAAVKSTKPRIHPVTVSHFIIMVYICGCHLTLPSTSCSLSLGCTDYTDSRVQLPQ